MYVSSSCPRKNVSYRVSRAIHGSKLLKPLFAHASLPVQAMRAFISCSNHKAIQSSISYIVNFLKRVFKVKSSYYHRVIERSEAECSNEFFAGLGYRSKRVMTPSQIYSHDRLGLFGHMLRHPESLEFHSAFMPSGYAEEKIQSSIHMPNRSPTSTKSTSESDS